MVQSVNESLRKGAIFKQVKEKLQKNIFLSHLGHEKS